MSPLSLIYLKFQKLYIHIFNDLKVNNIKVYCGYREQYFSVWLRNRMYPARLQPVFSHKKSCISLNYRQLSTNIKIKDLLALRGRRLSIICCDK